MAIKKNNLSKRTIWKEDNERFICFLDIMGFKDMVYSYSHDEIKTKLIGLSQSLQKIIDVIKSVQKGELNYRQFKNCEIRSALFSDSIIFITNEGNPSDFLLLTYAVRKIFLDATKLGIPIKGAISFGLLSANFDKSIFFGKPLISSYLLQEELQYYGIILDNHAENFLNKCGQDFKDLNLFFSMKTPLKKGNVIHSNLSLINKKLPYKYFLEFYKTVSGTPRIYVDNTIFMYESMKAIMDKLK
ncbi:MAG: hypothetical protein K8S00_01655 [Bacteroidales bacterium]|nr:hypothetical protein [Bacteroidales bacterium]